jgi:hypothetical protein
MDGVFTIPMPGVTAIILDGVELPFPHNFHANCPIAGAMSNVRQVNGQWLCTLTITQGGIDLGKPEHGINASLTYFGKEITGSSYLGIGDTGL